VGASGGVDRAGAQRGPERAAPTSRIDAMLARARAGLRRLHPLQAAAAVADGALIVDIRPAAQRAAEGEIPGALVIERNVLEWRLDPTSDARLPVATGDDLRVIIVCSEGYTSSLAAASLQELGLRHATDLVGGYRAWAAAGLPHVPGSGPAAAPPDRP
jgi:rhodanese-related sulfurtransferase